MKKNLGHDIEDRGVEGGYEEIVVDGKKILRKTPPVLDGTGQPAAAEDVGGD
jgi:hypothetical protein